MLNHKILNEIIADHAPMSATLQRVGLVGSRARDDFKKNSDVDLVFDTGDKLIDEAVLSAGLLIKSIIRDQFSTGVDIINYNTILIKANEKTETELITLGYSLMLKDLKWIWSKN